MSETAQGGPIMKPTWIMTDLNGGELAVVMTKTLKKKIAHKLEDKSKYFRISKIANSQKVSVSGTKNLGLTAKWPERFCAKVVEIWERDFQEWNHSWNHLCRVHQLKSWFFTLPEARSGPRSCEKSRKCPQGVTARHEGKDDDADDIW